MSRILFKEEQKYRHPWVWLIVTIIILGVLFLRFFGNRSLTQNELILASAISILICLGVYILFRKTRMEVSVLKDKIILRFPPFIRKEIVFSRDQIKRYYRRKYRPIKEYGGWGVKRKNKNNIAYNVFGNVGIQLELNNGKRILFGTQRAIAFESAMKKMMRDG